MKLFLSLFCCLCLLLAEPTFGQTAADALTAGRIALKRAQASPRSSAAAAYEAAIDKLKNAGDLDPRQFAIWDTLAEAYTGLAHALTGIDQTNAYNAAIASYEKSLALKPNDAALLTQIGILYLDSEQPEMSQNYFKKALDADPKFAEAFYRYGTALYRNGKVEGETGAQTFPPECKNSFKRYLQLQPGGPHAHQATAILAAMEQKVPQSYAPAPYWSEGQHPLIEQKQAETYLIKKVPPVYPLPAKEARIEGTVLIELMVAKNGEPHNMRVVSSPSVSLSLAALEALRQWRFQPMTSKGVAYDVFTSFAIKFTLPQ